MRKFTLITGLMAVFLFASLLANAEYDREMVVSLMRSNGAAFGALNAAVESGDYFTAAEKLMELAKSSKKLQTVTPPRGSKKQWDRIHTDLIKAAFRGIGAAGEEDSKKLSEAVNEIGALVKEGHSTFR
jgi:hypothetical protein